MNGRWPEMVKRAFGLKGAVGDSLSVSYGVNAVGRWEEDYLRAERRFSVSRTAPAGGAGQFGFVRLENPTLSQLAVVEALWIQTGGLTPLARQCSMSTQRSAGIGVAGGDQRALDGRIGGQATSGVEGRQGTRGAALFLGQFVHTDANQFGSVCIDPVRVVLPPGWSLEIENSNQANEQLTVSFVVRVFAMEPSELTGATP